MKKYNNLKKYLIILLKFNKKTLISTLFTTIFISVLNLFRPQIIKLILDDAILNKNIKFLINLSIIYLIINILIILLTIFNDFIYFKAKITLSNYLKLKIFNYINKLSGEQLANIETGNCMEILDNDVSIVENFGLDIIINYFINIFSIIISLIILCNIQLDLLIIVIFIQVIIAIIQVKIGNIVSLKVKIIRNIKGKIANIEQEYLYNIARVIMNNSVIFFIKNYKEKLRDISRRKINLNFMKVFSVSFSSFLSSCSIIVIYLIGGIKIISGKMTIGDIVVFNSYISLIINPCISIIKNTTFIQQALVSIDRIFNLLNQEKNIDNRNKIFNNNVINKIQLKNVKFSYDQTPILKDINMEFEKNKVTAIVGESGCGKSTIIKLLFRLWEIDCGEININGKNINNYNVYDIRKKITIITQDGLLLNDTILNNLTFNKNLEFDYIKNLCNDVGILELINKLPNGFNTIIGENGIKLSGGQKQRLSIVRALLQNNDVIIFDEATSALDSISQKMIINNIKKYINNKVIIIISHNLLLIENVDEIYVIEDGKIKEKGKHLELLNTKGKYYKFLNM